MDEIELITLCKKPDRKGQEILYSRFSDRMFRVAYRYVKNGIDTEDVLIVAFGKIFKGIGRFQYQGVGSLEAWIKKIVINEALMWLRKRHNFNLTEQVDEDMPEPDLTTFSEANAEDIYAMIARLPTGYRTVFNLNIVEGFNHEEIAGQLGINEGTSRSQLFKAKALLKKMLTKEGFNYGT